MDPVDWQTGKTHFRCTEYMLEKEIYCDVNFRVGENKDNLKAHKLILSMRSAVFDRMFHSSFCEAEKDPVVPDVTSAAFEMLLRYCYYECLDIEDDVALSVLYAAKKYMLPLLEEAARKKLIEILSVTNIWDVYKYATSVQDTKLLEGCHMYFQGNITSVKEALQAETFLNIPHKVLLDLLHINDNADNVPSLRGKPVDGVETELYANAFGMSISEIQLFKACNAWAEAECIKQEIDPTGANKRTVLGECLFLIRFPTMLFKDLVNVVYPTGILNQTEKDNLCQDKHSEAESRCQGSFPSSDRTFLVTTPEPPTELPQRSSVFIEPEERVLLSKVWVRGSGGFRVTVMADNSGESWSMKYDTRLQGHCTKEIEKTTRLLYIFDIKPQLLESGTKYSITAEWTRHDAIPDRGLVKKWLMVEDFSPFKEVQVTRDSEMGNCIYALTLCLL